MRKSSLVLSYTPMLMYEGLTFDEVGKIDELLNNQHEQVVSMKFNPELVVYRKDGKELGVIEKDTYLVWLEMIETTEIGTTIQTAAQNISERFGALEKIKQLIKDETGIGL